MFDMNYYFSFDVSKYIIKLQNYIIYKIFYFRIYTYILMLQRHHCILCVFCKSYMLQRHHYILCIFVRVIFVELMRQKFYLADFELI